MENAGMCEVEEDEFKRRLSEWDKKMVDEVASPTVAEDDWICENCNETNKMTNQLTSAYCYSCS